MAKQFPPPQDIKHVESKKIRKFLRPLALQAADKGAQAYEITKKRKFLRSLALQAADNGARSGRFTKDQPGESLWRTSSSVTADGSPGADSLGATAFEIQAFSGIQDLQQEAGNSLLQMHMHTQLAVTAA